MFMIYLIDEQEILMWKFSTHEDYDNLYALKGIRKDLDSDGLKDLVVFAKIQL